MIPAAVLDWAALIGTAATVAALVAGMIQLLIRSAR